MKNTSSDSYTNYITIQDIFHPECRQISAIQQQHHTDESIAVVVIDHDDDDDTNNNNQWNRWNVVWAEATLIPDHESNPIQAFPVSSSVPINSQSTTSVLPVISTSSSSPMNPSYRDEMNDPPDPVPITSSSATETVAGAATNTTKLPISTSTDTTNNTNTKPVDMMGAPYYDGNLMENLMGFISTVCAFSITFGLELTAICIYIAAVVLYSCAKWCHRQTLCCMFGILLYIIFIMISYILMIVDYSLLVLSIFLSESLAFCGGISCTVFTCCNINKGMIWHQYIRKLCHLSRWAFRDIQYFDHCHPIRNFPLCQHSYTRNTANSQNSNNNHQSRPSEP